MSFKFLSYLDEQDIPRAGLLVEGDVVIDLETALGTRKSGIKGLYPASLLSLLEKWERAMPAIEDIAKDRKFAAAGKPLSVLRLAAPILYPSSIYGAAANYLDHGREMKDTTLPDKGRARPYFFTKLARQTIIGPDEPIRIPYPEAKVDWEAEIGVVIGRNCRKVSASEAMDYVAGFTIINDLSDRARNFREDWHFKIDWLGGKSFETSAPMGPWITPAGLIPDPHDLAIRLWVNDELMQNASSRDMYFTIPEQIEYLSELVPLLPGDVIATGTPKGVGHARGLYLKAGDRVKITIEDLGTLQNPIIAGY